MMKFFRYSFCICIIGMAGCTHLIQKEEPAPYVPASVHHVRPAATDVTAGFHWDWDISGDPQVRPIQVFSNREKTWIQMAPHQVMPAIFVNGQPVPFDVSGHYITIAGAPDRIDVVATAYRAIATKRTAPIGLPAPRPSDVGRLRTIPSSDIK
jgi:hypothetical protein